MELADCYGAQPPATIRDLGYAGVLRYLSHQPGKCATGPELAAYRAADLAVGLIFEDGAAAAGRGAWQGAEDGAFAAVTARAVGYPAGCTLFAAVDFEAPDATPVIDYLHGFAAAVEPTWPAGVYGSADVVDAVVGAGACRYAWQTAAWSAGRISARADLYQHTFGVTFDGNTLIAPVPLWGLDQTSVPPTGGTHSTVHNQEDLMLFVRSTGTGGTIGHVFHAGAVFILTGGYRIWVPDAVQEAWYAKQLGRQPVDATPELIERWQHT